MSSNQLTKLPEQIVFIQRGLYMTADDVAYTYVAGDIILPRLKAHPYGYGIANRDLLDRSGELSDRIGVDLPHIITYIAVRNKQGRFLTYDRCGSEKGLHGNRSMGIGGHANPSNRRDTLLDIILRSGEKELEEEIGYVGVLDEESILGAIQSYDNPVSARHIALLVCLELSDEDFQEGLVLDPAEMKDVQWLTLDELFKDNLLYEDWSQRFMRVLNIKYNAQ